MPKLEDELSDIVSKAQRGLGISTSQLAEGTKLDLADVRAARSGNPSKTVIEKIAPYLNLRASGLWDIHEGRYGEDVPMVNGCTRIDTSAPMQGYEEMRVNAYLVSKPGSDEAVLFDTGTSLSAILEALGDQKLKAIFVTHTHWDHIDVIDEVIAHFPSLEVYGPAIEKAPEQTILLGSETLSVAGLEICVRDTPGHAHDGLSFLVKGLEKPVAVVGDALFLGSVGGIGPEDYTSGLHAIREHLLSLAPETVVAPGHADLSTISYEKTHNPFF